MTLVGLALLVAGAVATWCFARGGGTHHAEPRPGLTPPGPRRQPRLIPPGAGPGPMVTPPGAGPGPVLTPPGAGPGPMVTPPGAGPGPVWTPPGAGPGPVVTPPGAGPELLAMGGGPYRAGPWPGLMPRGAGLLLGCALLLAGGQLVLGNPARPLPDLPVLAALALAPLALATRLSRIPGAASAVCGAYLLPRSVISLLHPSLEPPPLLLVPALVFDVSLWLRTSDLTKVLRAWPIRRTPWRQRNRSAPHTPWPQRNRSELRPPWRVNRRDLRTRRPSAARACLAGALFGLTLTALEPPLAMLLGADPATWSGPDVRLAAAISAAVCALLGLSARGTES
jgi:hypothetical protein